jgi:hypothetical protein
MSEHNITDVDDAEDRAATTDELAAFDFEAWAHKPDEWVPPSNEEWAQLANPYLVTIRIAWTMLYKTKPEVMKFIDGIDEETGSQLMNGFIETINFFKGALEILEAAEARILCAGASMIEQDEAAAS